MYIQYMITNSTRDLATYIAMWTLVYTVSTRLAEHRTLHRVLAPVVYAASMSILLYFWHGPNQHYLIRLSWKLAAALSVAGLFLIVFKATLQPRWLLGASVVAFSPCPLAGNSPPPSPSHSPPRA